MKICTTRQELKDQLSSLKAAHQPIGLVPTMGALHEGHLELIRTAKKVTGYTVCSIFVNPTQFNDPRDLQNYPRTAEADIQKLGQENCDLLFMPSYEEMYSGKETWNLALGTVEQVLEGAFRPGHFQGVTQIVHKLFIAASPDIAFFGQKDYQQFVVIDRMTRMLNLPVKLVMCPVVREPDGLAMSSRNMRLTPAERKDALVLSAALKKAGSDYLKLPLPAVEENARQLLRSSKGVTLEYFQIADPATLEQANDHTEHPIALVAAKVGNIRLIDNLFLS